MLGRAHVDVMILCCSDSMFGTVQIGCRFAETMHDGF